ncbi:MAG: hypothetical protein LUC30_05870 [Clostridiales bacterium]|nr:hypothetical protein [Clostridiales bacterium]
MPKVTPLPQKSHLAIMQTSSLEKSLKTALIILSEASGKINPYFAFF